MTETRKRIIELISDYMDKSLSDGCIISNELIVDEEDIEIGKIIDWTLDDWLYTFEVKSFVNWICNIYVWVEEIDELKIFGHYDITAVLKYIDSFKNYYILFVSSNYIKILWYWDEYIGKILNKPLHLYTEQEEKDLLELLLKLKN